MSIFNRPKKLNSRGFSHLEIIQAAVVILAIVGIGVFVYSRYKTHADAANWTVVAATSNGMYIEACTNYYAVWGGVYQVVALYMKPASTFATAYYITDYNSAGYEQSNSTSNSWYYGLAGTGSVNVPANRGDYVSVGIKGAYGKVILGNANVNPASLVSCTSNVTSGVVSGVVTP